MGKTYEALKKSEAEKEPRPRMESIPVDGRKNPEIHWNVGAPARVEYQKIRVWLTNPAARGKRQQSVMVVSCYAGTGSTTTAALLAATLAEGKKSQVLIIDSNFRTPALNMVYQVRNNGGFTEVASEGMPFEAHIQPTNRKNLYVLTSGQIASYPAELFEGEAIDQLISQLKQRFDFIIFDAAPVLEFPDSYLLAPKVDSIILVAEANKTRIGEAQVAKQNLERAGGRILGVVLNRQRDYTPIILKRLFGIST
ncbi:MAG: CpsD/CapB family tyrosine-protein kinase [Candidatus Binatia bacterium]